MKAVFLPPSPLMCLFLDYGTSGQFTVNMDYSGFKAITRYCDITKELRILILSFSRTTRHFSSAKYGTLALLKRP